MWTLLLKPLRPCDAASIRARISDAGRRTDTGPNYRFTEFLDNDGVAPPSGALVHKLARLPDLPDCWNWSLTFNDLLEGEETEETWASNWLRRHKIVPKLNVIRDFRKDGAEHLEARDECLRSRQTDFGKLVAECVRREAGADIAVLNSGMFRCDARLPPELREEDLLEAFLYDRKGRDGSIMVLNMEYEDVQTLLKHGDDSTGKGAFPQWADEIGPAKKSLRIAISAYILIDEESVDGYVEALASAKNLDPNSLRKKFRDESITRHSVVRSIMRQISNVPYVRDQSPRITGDDAMDFVKLITEIIQLYRTEVADFGQVMRLCRELLNGSHQAVDHKLIALRDEIKELLKAAARKPYYEGTLPVAMIANLQHLRKRIAGHEATFRDNMPYASLFDDAADGIKCLDGTYYA